MQIKYLIETLTPREYQVLREYAILGRSKPVGEKLGLSSRTVHHYIEGCRKKLHCGTAFNTVVTAFPYLNIYEKDLITFPVVHLTPVLQSVLFLIAQGFGTESIANVCDIQEKSVNLYINKILYKTYGKLTNRIQLFTYMNVVPNRFTLMPAKPTIRDSVIDLATKGLTTEQIVKELDCNYAYVSSLMKVVEKCG